MRAEFQVETCRARVVCEYTYSCAKVEIADKNRVIYQEHGMGRVTPR